VSLSLPEAQDAPPEMYVALGDSISIDVYAGGPGRGGASLLARNRDDDFPDWRGHDLATTPPQLGFGLLAAEAAKEGRIPCLRLGGTEGPLRFVEADLRKWLECARAAWQPGDTARDTLRRVSERTAA
jgi:hypothetical protein